MTSDFLENICINTFFVLGDMYPNGGKQQPGCPLRNALTNLIGKSDTQWIGLCSNNNEFV